jgi:CP family cyanate transporter-like MFS transporter
MGMLLVPNHLTWLWMFLVGVGSSCAFSAVLIFVVERSPDLDHAAALSGMAQAVGYGIGATSPFLFGALNDLTGSWTAPLAMVLAAMVPFTWAALGAARPGLVGQSRSPDRPAPSVAAP